MKHYQLREALNNNSDFDAYLNIKSDREAIVFSGFAKAPDADVFRNVYERIMTSGNEKLYFLCDNEVDDRVVASFHLGLVSENEAEIMGYNVLPQYRGKGVGKRKYSHQRNFRKKSHTSPP